MSELPVLDYSAHGPLRFGQQGIEDACSRAIPPDEKTALMEANRIVHALTCVNYHIGGQEVVVQMSGHVLSPSLEWWEAMRHVHCNVGRRNVSEVEALLRNPEDGDNARWIKEVYRGEMHHALGEFFRESRSAHAQYGRTNDPYQLTIVGVDQQIGFLWPEDVLRRMLDNIEAVWLLGCEGKITPHKIFDGRED